MQFICNCNSYLVLLFIVTPPIHAQLKVNSSGYVGIKGDPSSSYDLKVHGILEGKQIKQITVNERGNTSITINGYELEAGMYLYTLIADGKEVDTKKMILTE